MSCEKAKQTDLSILDFTLFLKYPDGNNMFDVLKATNLISSSGSAFWHM